MHHRHIYLSVWRPFVEIVCEESALHFPFLVLMKIKSKGATSEWEMCIIVDKRLSIWKTDKYIQLWRMTRIRRVTPKIIEVWIKKNWRNSRLKSMWNLITSKACWIWYNQWLKNIVAQKKQRVEICITVQNSVQIQLPRKKNYDSTRLLHTRSYKRFWDQGIQRERWLNFPYGRWEYGEGLNKIEKVIVQCDKEHSIVSLWKSNYRLWN